MLNFFSGCANQQPPGGGEEDKIPPKVKVLEPRANTLNYRGNSLSFEFNEYVDRRSFQDAFRISPQIKGDIDFNWSGKSVDVVFPKSFYKINSNKTFVVTVNTALKDIHGNPLTSPVAFAFATGDKIDEASIAGKVFNNSNKNISIFAYNLSGDNYDPTKNIADYTTETSPEGEYTLTNMAPGNYRLIAIDDDDKNFLYTTDRESFGVLPGDLTIEEKSALKRVNFFMKQVAASDTLAELNTDKYFKDTAGIISTSIKNDAQNILPDQSIFVFFNRFKLSREDLINNLQVKDEDGTPEKVVFNWRNDSLVEIFSAVRFTLTKGYNLSINVKTDKDTIYRFNLKFRIVNNNSFGEIKGVVRYFNADSTEISQENVQIKLNLDSKDIIPQLKYSFDITDSVFTFNKILEADYTIFSFIDTKATGNYFYGSPFPFEYSDPFYIYPQVLSVKGGWTVENIQINFVK